MATPLRVLLVEDNADDAELLLAELARSGFAPAATRVETAPEMAAALATASWDVVLSDYSLPAFGASQALDLLRQSMLDIPAIVVSGTIGEEQAVETMRTGANDYILKQNLTRLAPAITRELRAAEHRRARRAAELATHQLAAIVQSSEDAITSKTLDGIITSWNPAAERLYGWSAAEAIGQPIALIVPPERTGEMAEMMRQLRCGEPINWAETVRIRKDGQRIDVAVTISPIRNAVGQQIGASTITRDISERKRWEAERQRQAEVLRQSEERHRLLIESIPHMVWMTGPDGLTDFLNQRGAARLGVPATAVHGMGWLQLIHPDDREPARLIWEAAFQHGTAYQNEYRVRQADGTLRWYLSQGVPVHGPNGDLEKWVGTWTDIDDRKHAEQALAASEARFRAVVLDQTEVISRLRGDGTFVFVNDAYCRFFGRTREEILGTRWHALAHADDIAQIEARLAELRPDQPIVRIENRMVDARGDVHWLEFVNRGYFGTAGELVEIMSVGRDVSDRKRAEQALQLRDRAIQAVAQGILITEASGDCPIVYASPGFARLTGYPADDVLGGNCRFLQGKATDPEAVALIREAVRQGRPCTVELLNYRKDGTAFWNELSISPVHDAAGQLTHYVGVQTDVTQRRRLEEQYRQAQKMEAIGQLAGGVAHDFNNLLTIINGYSELLLQALHADDPMRRLADQIHKAGERSAGLTRQLLTFSRQQVVAPTVLYLNGILTNLEKMLRRIIGEDVVLDLVLAPNLGAVKVDAGQIEQVIMNLAVNARDAMPQGGTLTIETCNIDLAEAHAQVHAGARLGPHVLLAVRDTGCGMTPEVRARVFEPFFTTKETGKGTGLGLAVVHGIIQQSGGHIAVDSAPGAGTTIHVYLPRVQPNGAPRKSNPAMTPAPRGSETLLLVEDEEAVRTMTRQVLADCGYQVLEASHGAEALALAAQHTAPIQLLVTDVVMPEVGGRLLAERLVALHPEAKVLYVSGYTDDAVVRHGILHDEVSLLQKPFSPRALAHKVRDVLDSRDAKTRAAVVQTVSQR